MTYNVSSGTLNRTVSYRKSVQHVKISLQKSANDSQKMKMFM